MIRFEHHRLTLNWYCYNFGLYYNCLIYCNIILILLFRSNTTDTPQLGQRPFKLTTLYCLFILVFGIHVMENVMRRWNCNFRRNERGGENEISSEPEVNPVIRRPNTVRGWAGLPSPPPMMLQNYADCCSLSWCIKKDLELCFLLAKV